MYIPNVDIQIYLQIIKLVETFKHLINQPMKIIKSPQSCYANEYKTLF